MAGLAFAASLGAEGLVGGDGPLRLLSADSLMFLAIAFWAGFHATAAATAAEEFATGRVMTVAVSSARLVRRLA
jgi:hypothetical protein